MRLHVTEYATEYFIVFYVNASQENRHQAIALWSMTFVVNIMTVLADRVEANKHSVTTSRTT